MTKYIFIYYLIINLLLFILMAADKEKAKKHKWRIKEATLFLFSFLGGSIGGFFGMFLLHHKNKKVKFYIIFMLSLIIHILVLYLFYFYVN